MASSSMKLAVLVVVLQLFLLQLPQVYGRPGTYYNTPQKVYQPCLSLPDEVEKLCQQCAKHTKSNVVYPMCCEDKEEAREFCRRYLSFGLH